jgi:hypothetical protein
MPPRSSPRAVSRAVRPDHGHVELRVPRSSVTVRVFEGFLSRVFAEVRLPLATRPDLTSSLPAFPGYTQTSAIFDPLLPATGSRDVGVEIIGLRPRRSGPS